MTDTSTEAVDRLVRDLIRLDVEYKFPTCEVAAHTLATLAADRDALRADNERLKEQVIAYGGPWAVRYAEDRGLPEGHLHPTHYDDLANAGARMDSFTRAALDTKGGEA